MPFCLSKTCGSGADWSCLPSPPFSPYLSGLLFGWVKKDAARVNGAFSRQDELPDYSLFETL